MKFKPPAFVLRHRKAVLALSVVLIIGVFALSSLPKASAPKTGGTQATSKPALTVAVTQAQTLEWPQILPASGNVAAWQEAVIGAEISNYRITEVRANVGDVVTKGQVLARIDSATVASEQAEAQATVSELEATLAEAKANSERARQ